MPTSIPPCSRLGRQCRALRVTLRIGTIEEGRGSLDAEATWLLGHTQRIDFDAPREDEGELYTDAVIHVPCKHLETEGGRARCRAHGFTGPTPRAPTRAAQPRRLGGDRFLLVDDHTPRRLEVKTPRRALPVVGDGSNPCATARCRTNDHVRGAACCRDLQVEIMCTREETELEALVRSRKAPYLCKVERPGDWSIEAEIISACDYLLPGTVNCALHGRVRADGRSAKPDLCFDWPPKRKVLHWGCVFGPKKRR
jgi:hypothetical protein